MRNSQISFESTLFLGGTRSKWLRGTFRLKNTGKDCLELQTPELLTAILLTEKAANTRIVYRTASRHFPNNFCLSASDQRARSGTGRRLPSGLLPANQTFLSTVASVKRESNKMTVKGPPTCCNYVQAVLFHSVFT